MIPFQSLHDLVVLIHQAPSDIALLDCREGLIPRLAPNTLSFGFQSVQLHDIPSSLCVDERVELSLRHDLRGGGGVHG